MDFVNGYRKKVKKQNLRKKEKYKKKLNLNFETTEIFSGTAYKVTKL